jgi:hypothetical protein
VIRAEFLPAQNFASAGFLLAQDFGWRSASSAAIIGCDEYGL